MIILMEIRFESGMILSLIWHKPLFWSWQQAKVAIITLYLVIDKCAIDGLRRELRVRLITPLKMSKLVSHSTLISARA